MKTLIKTIIHRIPLFLMAFLGFAFGGCSEDGEVIRPSDNDNPDTFTLDITLEVADILDVRTRAFEDTPSYTDLKLFVIEFDRNGDEPLNNTLSADLTGTVSEETLNADGDMHFKLELNKTSEAKIIHFIAVPKDSSFDINLESGTDYTEGTIIPALRTEHDTPAYWQRLEFPTGYGTFDVTNVWTTSQEAIAKLTHIPMIRNFAKISVASNAAGFFLDGFAVVNQAEYGTVAPWRPSVAQFPTLLDDSNTMLSYSTINETYKGYWPYDPVTDVYRKSASSTSADYIVEPNDIAPKYIYERPNSSINNPYILVKGRRSATGATMYYKLDLGHSNENTPFAYFDIIRNFEYAITINAVSADGYSTIADAMNGVVYNNLSFDINTRQMLNVSNGRDMLWVNQATFVVTNSDETTIHFYYRYRKGIGTGGGTLSNGTVKFIGLGTDNVPGEAIESVSFGSTDDADGWREVTITTKEPTTDRLAQSFVIYDEETGLGRTINIIVRQPWNYIDPVLYGVNYDTYQQFLTAQANNANWLNRVSSNSAGQPITISFHIDDNIPEAMFPLEFVFEANPQNIENNKSGNLVVRTEPSYFSATNQPTMKYVKTVTWADYNSDLTEDNPTGTEVTVGNNTFHFVRARFLTINTVSGTTNRIRVYNPYIRVEGSTSKYLDFTYSAQTGEGPDLAE